MGNMRFKVGDRVRIKSLDWYKENKDEYGYIDCGSRAFFTKMSNWCGKIATIKEICKTNCYRLEEYDFDWTDEMIEGLVEEEVDLIPKFGEFSDNEPLDIPTMTTEFVKEHGLPCPEGYIFKDENGNVINATKIVLEKKKKEYPKTYEECCEMLDFCGEYFFTTYEWGIHLSENDNIIKIHQILKSTSILTKLLICRDAYWKIAGEEMELGKPWEPDYTDPDHDRYAIAKFMGNIEKCRWDYGYSITFVFPTEEMRDAFYENFKELIEFVKELL